MFIINNLLSLLEKKGLKQADLCEAIGISSSTMTNWKNRGTDPPAKHIIPICEFLNISPYYLLTGEEKELSRNNINCNNAIEKEALNLFKQLPEHEQLKLIGRMEILVEDYEKLIQKNNRIKLKIYD